MMDDGVPQRSENESPWDHIRRIKERPDLRLRLHGDRSTHAPDGLPQVRLRVAKRTHERFSFRRVAGACAVAFFEQAEASGVAQRHPARVFTPQPLLTVTSTSPSDTHADDEEDRQQQQEQSGGGGGGGGGGGNNLEFGLHNLDAVLGMLAAADKGMWRLEHSPKFWDFEAARWIRARDWKGTNNSSK